MRRTIAFVLAGMSIASAGCVKSPSITVPDCAIGSFTRASQSGDTIITTEGLRYIEGLPGDLSSSLTGWCRPLSVHYDAYLTDGTRFDSSHDLGLPLVFRPGFGDLIDGFEQGVINMHVGATRRLIIPPSLGFGSEARRDANGNIIVPANSTLIYDVEVVEVGQ